jgi:hypothetical protein
MGLCGPGPSTLCGWQRVARVDLCVRIRRQRLYVTELTLDGYDLNGYLPAAISNLTNCISLTIEANPKLSGTIPSLDNLTQLQYLELHTNALTGSIPSLDKLTQP